LKENDTFLKMRGVFAVPGIYEKNGVRYVKTAEELKDAAERYPILPITFGHTNTSEPPPPSAQIGTMKQSWSEAQQKAIAEFWFDKKKMPEVLRSRAYNAERLPLSAWFLADSKDEEDALHGIAYSHVAMLEGEDPVCPLTECGAFVVAESKTSSRQVFVERLQDLEPAQEDKEQEPEVAPEPTPDVAAVEEEAPKTEPPAEENLAESDAQEQVHEVVLEPETIIPAEVSQVEVQKNRPFDVVDGKYVFVPQIFKQQQEKK